MNTGIKFWELLKKHFPNLPVIAHQTLRQSLPFTLHWNRTRLSTLNQVDFQIKIENESIKSSFLVLLW